MYNKSFIRNSFAVFGRIFSEIPGLTRDRLIHCICHAYVHRESSVFKARLVSIQLTCFVVNKVVQSLATGNDIFSLLMTSFPE